MDPPTGPENPIAACSTMLSLRHFSTCRDYARHFPPSDSLSKILAIADVLSAADHYSVLHLPHSDAVDRDLARRQYAKLALLLDPTSTDKFPFSDEALARVREAWHVLSDPERRSLYNRDLEFRGGDPTATFWTACPYCWNLYQYEKKYEGCSLLCQSCQKAFHGVAVKPPVKEGTPVVEAEERRQYYWCRTSVPLKYYEVQGKGVHMGNDMMMGEKMTHLVYVSDDDDGCNEGLGKKVGEGGVRNEGCERVVSQGNGTVELQGGSDKRRMRVKAVAKKHFGNRMTRCVDNDNDLGLGLDAENGELEFTEGDDDVFVGVRFDG